MTDFFTVNTKQKEKLKGKNITNNKQEITQKSVN